VNFSCCHKFLEFVSGPRGEVFGRVRPLRQTAKYQYTDSSMAAVATKAHFGSGELVAHHSPETIRLVPVVCTYISGGAEMGSSGYIAR